MLKNMIVILSVTQSQVLHRRRNGNLSPLHTSSSGIFNLFTDVPLPEFNRNLDQGKASSSCTAINSLDFGDTVFKGGMSFCVPEIALICPKSEREDGFLFVGV